MNRKITKFCELKRFSWQFCNKPYSKYTYYKVVRMSKIVHMPLSTILTYFLSISFFVYFISIAVFVIIIN